MVEIDILSECKHKHVVGMYEAYYHENKLWVSSQQLMLQNVLNYKYLNLLTQSMEKTRRQFPDTLENEIILLIVLISTQSIMLMQLIVVQSDLLSSY